MPNTLLDIEDPNGNNLMLLILRRALTSLETDRPVRVTIYLVRDVR